MPKRLLIREYKKTDRNQVIDCLIVLQNYERSLERHKILGQKVAKKYFGQITAYNQKGRGKIFVADINGKVAGIVNVRIEKTKDALCDFRRYAYVSDIYVRTKYRKQGLGDGLLQTAENYAKNNMTRFLKFEVLAKNSSMRQLAAKSGFREYEVSYLKKVS